MRGRGRGYELGEGEEGSCEVFISKFVPLGNDQVYTEWKNLDRGDTHRR